MIATFLLPESLSRPSKKSELERRLEFLERLIDEVAQGQHLHESIERNWYPALSRTPIHKALMLSLNQGMTLTPALQEFARDARFRLERDREIAIEIAPARATLRLLTFFPALILIGAVLGKIIHLDRTLLAPIPIAMIAISVALQILGRRWAESIIASVRQ